MLKNEIQSFPTQEDFDKFDLELTKKIANDKTIKIGTFVVTGWKDVGYQTYECLVCGQLWKLSAPDYANRTVFKADEIKPLDHCEIS